MAIDFDQPDPRLVQSLIDTWEASARRIRETIIAPPGRTDSSRAFNLARANTLLAQVNDEIARLKRFIAGWTSNATETAFKQGLITGEKQFAALGGVRVASPIDAAPFKVDSALALIDRRTVETFARDTAGDLYKAADSVQQTSGTLLRRMAATGVTNEQVNQILAGRHVIEGQPVQAVRDLRELLRKVHGDTVTVIDKNGDPIEFKVGHYAKLVATTKTREASVIARHERLAQRGMDLVVIVGRVSKNFCSAYLGKVYSLSGKHPDYPAYSSLPGRGAPFHPQCSKSSAPFVEALASPADLENAAPDPETAKLLDKNDTTALQRTFRESRMENAVKDRVQSIAEDIRARARKAGYEPPPYSKRGAA